MTCQDCGLTIEEEEVGDSKTLALAFEYMTLTSRCFACDSKYVLKQRIREMKGEVKCQTKQD